MTIHVSLPNELENQVHQQVSSGLYSSASEVVREALRRFFSQSQGNGLSSEEIAMIRRVIAPRLDAVRDGKAQLVDGAAYFDDAISRLSE